MMQIKITPNDSSNPPGKLADVELHFVDSGTFDYAGLQGLKLVGFGIWESKHGNKRNVTFPARSYTVNGERRSFALLRPLTDAASSQRLVDLILAAYQEHQEQDTAAGLDTFTPKTAADSQHKVTVALMNIPTVGKLEEPKPITKPARYTPPARSQAPLGF